MMMVRLRRVYRMYFTVGLTVLGSVTLASHRIDP
jgi:hypothetical protein